MSDERMESLALTVEAAWLELVSRRRAKPIALYLTPRDRVVGFKLDRIPAGAVEIGSYTDGVTLIDFRQDVFHVFDQRSRGIAA